jgi:hypothetical protein
MTQEKPQPSSQSPLAPSMTEAINSMVTDGRLSCVDAFAVVTQMNVAPLSIGGALNNLSIKLKRCQLGLFGYPGKQGWRDGGVMELAVPDGLEAAIVEAGGPQKVLPCLTAWRLADRFAVPRLQLGWLAEKLGIRIAVCQLGAF